MIKVEGLRYDYGRVAITYPDFEVSSESRFSILGNSGSGKTTLLHLMAGILAAQEGSIKIGDVDLVKLSERSRDKFRGSQIGLVFQKPHLLSALTVGDNLLTSQFFGGKKQQLSRVEEVLNELGLADKIKAKPSQLSQGEAQRVAIARAVINKPKVIMADEPTSSLDDDNCEKVLNMLIKEATTYQAALLVVTHDQRVKEIIKNGINLTAA